MPAPPHGGDTSAAVAFLAGFAPQGPWIIIHDLEAADQKTGRWPAAQFWPGQEAQLANAIEAHQGRNNIYFVVNLPASFANIRTSPSEEEIIAYYAVPLDIDLPANHTPEQLNDVVDAIKAITPRVNVIIYSGGGVQAFWIFLAPLPRSKQPDYERAVLYFADMLGGDHIQNANRLMRLPGTINVLNDKKRAAGRSPAPSYIIHQDWEPRITLEDDVNVPRTPATRYDPNDLKGPWPSRITTGATDWIKGNDKSKSAAVFGITCQLVREGWPDDVIITLLTNPNYGISQHVLEQAKPQDYAKRQATQARAAVARDFIRNDKGMIIADNYENMKKGFTVLGTTLSYDSFADRILYVNGEIKPALFGDPELKTYRIKRFAEELRFRPSKDYFADTVATIAYERSYHPVRDYLSSLTWDRTKRLDTWIIDMAGAPDTPYTRAVSRLILVAAVTRIREPGRKFDEMLVFESPQGRDKSTALHILAVHEEWFGDSLSLAASNKEVIEQLAGKWIIEAADLSGMRKSDIESLKAFLSRQTDRARLAYARFPIEHPRSCVFFGTTNSTRYLRDEANRRFWPVVVHIFNTPALAAIRDQLWAEAAQAHANGEPIRLDPSLYAAAAHEQRLRRVEDPWIDIFEYALSNQTGRLITADVWRIIGKQPGNRFQEDNRRLGEAMRELGWERIRTSRTREEGPQWFYMKGTSEERKRDLYVYPPDHEGGTPKAEPRRGPPPPEETPF